MTYGKTLLMVGVAGLMGAAVPAPAQATWGCWFGKCGGGSSSSGGTPTPVPEPEQMALFAMGAAVLCGRAVVAHRKNRRK